jgi:hypothetical protein
MVLRSSMAVYPYTKEMIWVEGMSDEIKMFL